jgi:hypothetical protein
MKSGLAMIDSRAWGRRISLQSVLATASARMGEYPARNPRWELGLAFVVETPEVGRARGLSRRGKQLSACTHRQEPV